MTGNKFVEVVNKMVGCRILQKGPMPMYNSVGYVRIGDIDMHRSDHFYTYFDVLLIINLWNNEKEKKK